MEFLSELDQSSYGYSKYKHITAFYEYGEKSIFFMGGESGLSYW